MKFASLFVERFGGLRSPLAYAGRFLQARISPAHYLGFHLTLGVTLICAGCWVYAMVAGNVVDDNSLATFSQRLGSGSDFDFVPNAAATEWETDLLGSRMLLGFTAIVLAMLLAKRRSWNGFVFLIMVLGGDILLDQSFQVPIRHFRSVVRMLPLPERLTGSFPSDRAMAVTLFYGGLVGIAAFTVRGPGRRAVAYLVSALVIFRACSGFVYLGVESPREVLEAIAISVAWLTFCFTVIDTLRRRRSILGRLRAAAT